MNKFTWIVIAVLVVAGAFYFGGKEEAQTGPVKIGIMAPLTGDAVAYGEPALNIYKLALKEINDAGGVNGNMLELVVEDSKCNGASGTSAAQKLANVDKVQVIVGGICSGETIPAVPVAEKAKIAMISPGASSPDLTNISKFFVRNNPSDSAQGKILAQIAVKEGAKTIYALAEQTDYARGVVGALESSFSQSGGKTTVEYFASNLTDLRQQVAKAKSANQDVFMISVQTPATAQRIMKAMRDLQWKPKFFVGDVVSGDPDTMTNYKDVLEGAYTAEIGSDPENPIFKRALSQYKETYGKEMPYQGYGQTEWDALFLVRDAIKAVGYDGEKIANWLRTEVKDWEGAVGKLTINGEGDPEAGHRGEIIRNGKAEVLK